MTELAIRHYLKKNGWTNDNFGNMRKVIKNKVYRYKFQSRVVRLEIQIKNPKTEIRRASTSWVRISSGYYSRINVLNNNLSFS